MAKRTEDGVPSSPPSGGDLARLLETEARLEERLRRARDEAVRLVAEAREAARAREETLGAELEATAHELEEAIAGERRLREQELAEEARGATERFDAVEPEGIADLARFVVSRMIGGAA